MRVIEAIVLLALALGIPSLAMYWFVNHFAHGPKEDRKPDQSKNL